MGQNFLSDPATAAWIVDQLRVEPQDLILEIGPGLGALTEHLLGKGRHLILLEKDAQLAARLRTEMAGKNVTLIEGDAVTFDLRPYFKEQPLKVIGALPYSCGTEIVRNFLRNPSPVHEAVFVLQKEVCDRICAPPNSPDRGLLSLRLQSRWQTSLLKKLPPDIFVPRPKVDSAVIRLTPRPRQEFPPFDDQVLDRLLRLGFHQRRKMLRKLLPDSAEPWEHAASRLGFSPTARAQELDLAQWIGLSLLHDDHHLKEAQSGDEIFDVVDEEDRPIGREKRSVVHASGLKHRAVHLFVFDKRGDLWLQKRSHLKDAMPEKWDSSAAGHLDAGEDYLPAAVRELKEEVGLEVAPSDLQKIARIPPSPETGWEWVELFAVRAERKMRFPCSEIECLEHFSISEVEAWISARPQDFADGFIACFRAWRTSEHEVSPIR